MNISDTVELLHALKYVGATHFKSSEIEVSLEPLEDVPGYKLSFNEVEKKKQDPQPQKSKQENSVEPIEQHTSYDPEATQRAQDLIDLLKMKDDELVNQIFPDGAL